MGQGQLMNTLMTLMYQQQTLIAAAVVVGLLAYIGSNTISPSQIRVRQVVAYVCGTALTLIGAVCLSFGLSKLLVLLFAGSGPVDLFRLEWTAVGMLSLIMGFALARQGWLRS